MEPNIDQRARDARDRAEHVKESLAARIEDLGRRFNEVRRRIDLDTRIAAHPLTAVGIAFAAGALLGLRGGGKRALPDDAAERTLTSAITAAITAIAMRIGRDYALRRVSGAARTWFDKRKAGTSPRERSSSNDPSVESFLEH